MGEGIDEEGGKKEEMVGVEMDEEGREGCGYRWRRQDRSGEEVVDRGDKNNCYT